MAREKHVLVGEFLKNHSLVESNITSFNNFIGSRIQEIVDDLSEKIKWVFENFDKSMDIALQAQQYASKEFDIKDMVRKYEEVYQSLRGMWNNDEAIPVFNIF